MDGNANQDFGTAPRPIILISVGRVPSTTMQSSPLRLILPFVAAMALVPRPAVADDIRVAVASNFRGAMELLAGAFEAKTDSSVVLSVGSTGKHYAQIRNGAPFDVFFAADSERPKRLEEEGLAVSGTRFTYAIGKLVLWCPTPGIVDLDRAILDRGAFRYVAIANPSLAPYGAAAREVLEARGLWNELDGRIVRGENIGQAFQFVESGNAEIGFVAYAQVKGRDAPTPGSVWIVPQSLYTPIEQQAVLLRDSAAARDFLAYVRSDEALKMIRESGYDTP